MTTTLFSVTLTWSHVVVQFRVPTVEIGTSQMEIDCQSMALSTNVVSRRKLSSIVEVPPLHLVSIAVIFQLMLSMIMVWERLSMWDCMPVEV